MAGITKKKSWGPHTGKWKVFVVDDHPVVRQGLTILINQTHDLMVCGEAGDTDAALARITCAQPDMVIVDLLLGDSNAIGLIEKLNSRKAQLPILVLSMYSEQLWAERVLRAGARGFVMKSEAAEKLINAIRQVRGGDIYLSDPMKDKILHKLVGKPQTATASPLDTLTTRELHVFQLIGRGRSTREISGKLNIGVKTVQTYCSRIKEKLSLANARELITQAVHLVQLGKL